MEGDLLDLLLAAHLEDQRRISMETVVGEMAGMVFAGHETTALTLAWLFFEVSRHQEVEARLLEEAQRAFGERLPAFDDLAEMPYGERVVFETMRYYPPVYMTLREAIEDDQAGGFDIRRGTRLILNIRGLHHHPDYWPQPNRFDPDRFAPEWRERQHSYAFMPFLEGPRKLHG